MTVRCGTHLKNLGTPILLAISRVYEKCVEAVGEAAEVLQ